MSKIKTILIYCFLWIRETGKYSILELNLSNISFNSLETINIGPLIKKSVGLFLDITFTK